MNGGIREKRNLRDDDVYDVPKKRNGISVPGHDSAPQGRPFLSSGVPSIRSLLTSDLSCDIASLLGT